MARDTLPSFEYSKLGSAAPPEYELLLQQLGAMEAPAVRDPDTGWVVVTKLADVQHLLGDELVGFSRSSTLSPREPLSKFAADPRNLPDMLQVATIPPATADAGPKVHSQTVRAVFGHARQALHIDTQVTKVQWGTLIQEETDLTINRMQSDAGEHGTRLDLTEYIRPLVDTIICKMFGLSGHEKNAEYWAKGQTDLLSLPLSKEERHIALGALSDFWSNAKNAAELEKGDIFKAVDSHLSYLIRRSKLTARQAGGIILNQFAAGRSTMEGSALNMLVDYLDPGSKNRTYWVETLHVGSDEDVAKLTEEQIRRLTGLIGWKQQTKRWTKNELNLPRNTTVVAGLAIAGRDPMFTNPNEVRLNRAERDVDAFDKPLRSPAFGFGVHKCMGQGLARLTLQTMSRSLREAFPAMRLAVDVRDVSYGNRPNPMFRSPESVPVETAKS